MKLYKGGIVLPIDALTRLSKRQKGGEMRERRREMKV